jgi:hypothetical protein
VGKTSLAASLIHGTKQLHRHARVHQVMLEKKTLYSTENRYRAAVGRVIAS